MSSAATGRGESRAAIGYGLASATANAMGYVVTVLLVRALSPEEFGAIGALFAVGIIGTIPATAIQLSMAKQAVLAHQQGTAIPGSVAARHGLVVGLGLAVCFGVAALPLSHYLHLDRPELVLVVGITLVPMLVSSSLQGVMLGTRRFNALSASTLAIGATRVAAVPVGLAAGAGVMGVLVAIAAAASLSALVTLWLTASRGAGSVSLRSLVTGASHGTVTLTAYFLVTNVDIPVARHTLDPADSGAYVLGSLFTKICLWGPQFVSVVAFPRMGDGQLGRRATLRACGITAGLGGLGAVLLVPLGGPVLALVSGDAPAGLARLAPWFGVLGALWAVLHTVVLHEVATLSARQTWWLWLTVVSMVAALSAVPRPATVGSIVATALAVSVLAVGVGLARVALMRTSESSDDLGNPVGPTTEELLAEGNQKF